MKKMVLIATALLVSAFSSASMADGRKKSIHDQLTGGGYGLAGCGLGSVIFGAKPGMIQIVAATSNDIYSNQAIGISFGTSNCDISEMGMEAVSYIEINRETLKKEAARGQGETLQDLAGIFNCRNQSGFEEVIHQNFSEIFMKNENSYESSRQIMKVIEQNKKLDCQNS
ncbi:MAG: hypothetical protein RJB66_998 [Pseudomonadota bacterium]